MDRYQLGKAKNLIAGYFFTSPSKPSGKSEEFKRAQRECLANLQKQLQDVQSVTESEFFQKRNNKESGNVSQEKEDYKKRTKPNRDS